MAISFQCTQCEKAYKVADTMAGKRGKCTACGAVLVIPGNAGFAAEPSPPSAAPPPNPFAVQAQAPPEMFTPAGPSTLEAGLAEDAAPARTRRKSGGGKKVLIFVSLGVLLAAMLGGAGWAVYALFFRSGLGEELTYLPDGCHLVAKIRVAEIMDSAAFKEVKAEIPELEKALKDLTKKSSNPADIDFVMIGATAKNGGEFVAVIKSSKIMTVQSLRDDNPGVTYAEVKVGKYSVQKAGQDDEPSACLVNSNLAVVGFFPALKKVLERDKAPVLTLGMKAALDEADMKQSICVAIDIEGAAKEDLSKAKDLGADLNMVKGNVQGVKAAIVEIGIGSEIRFKTQVLCDAPAKANELKTQADDGMNKAKEMAKQLGPIVPSEVMDIVNGIKIEANGARVIVTSNFKVKPLVKAVKGKLTM